MLFIKLIISSDNRGYMEVFDEKAKGFLREATKEDEEFMRRTEEERKRMYKVWEVSYDYKAPQSDIPSERVTEVMYFVSENIGGAEIKADEYFSRDGTSKEILAQGLVRKCIREFIQEVPFPKLTLEEDAKSFHLGAKIEKDLFHSYSVSRNRDVLAYIVKKYIVLPSGKR